MANGYFERGEVYWVGRTGEATLGVVISSKQDNFSHEFIAVATLCGEEPYRGVQTNATGRTSWVACANIRTVSKRTVKTFVGVLTPAELEQVDTHLEELFDLGYEDDGKQQEIDDLKKEVARLKREVEYGKEGILSRAAEVSKYQKLYEKAVDQIADMTLAADVAQRIAEKTATVEVEEEPEPKPEPELEEMVEPESKVEPVESEEVPEPEAAVEFTPEVVNVNTASAQEISSKTGLPLTDAYSITGYRKKNGYFVELEELLEVSRISKPKFEKFKEWFTLGDEEPVEENEPEPELEPEPEIEIELVEEKVNVNTANIYELMRAGFGKSESGRIVRWVKKYGPFTSLDDLTKVDGVTGKVLRKIRDGLEV